MNILFVCTGNTCRSPMAEAILKHISQGETQVKSAGVFAVNGNEASPHAKMVMDIKGIKHNHSSAQVTGEMVEWASYIFTMTNQHKQMLHAFYPNAGEKIYTLKEFVGSDEMDVLDPFGGSVKIYEQTYDELFQQIQKLHNKLR